MEKDGIIHRELSCQIIVAAIELQRLLGSGFLEAVYESASAHEFNLREIPYERQKALQVCYKDIVVGDYFADFIIGGKVILEIKAISKLNPAHEAQAHHYLAATGYVLAILINFGAPTLEYKRIVRSHRIENE